MRWMIPLLLVASTLLFPTGAACSLIYEPFKEARWDDALMFSDGGRLVRVVDGQEQVIAEGFFVSYAVQDGYVLVAGQTGLGADCSGENWLRLYEADGDLVWEKDGEATVWDRADAPPIARHDGKYWTLAGSSLELFKPAVQKDAHILHWMGETPIVLEGQTVRAGNKVVASQGWSVAAHHTDTFAVLSAGAGGESEQTAQLSIVGRTQTNVSWPISYGGLDLVHTDAWYAIAGSNMYRIGQDVLDFGPADGIGTKGSHTLRFHDNKLTVYDGTHVVERYQRFEGVWLPSTHNVPAPAPVGEQRSESTPTSIPPATDADTPGPAPFLLAIALLGVALAAHRSTPRF